MANYVKSVDLGATLADYTTNEVLKNELANALSIYITNSQLNNRLSSERPDYVVPTVPGTSKTYEHNGLYLLRTDNAKDFYSAIDCSFEEFEEKFDYVEIPKEIIEYRHGSVFMPTDTGIYSKFVSTNVDVNKVYYYFFVVLKETTTINRTLSGYNKDVCVAQNS